MQLAFIQPGKPNQNAYFERFNRSCRTEILNAWVFTTLDEVRELSEDGRQSYNTERTHDALGGVPPLTFLPRASSAVFLSHMQRFLDREAYGLNSAMTAVYISELLKS